MNGREFVRRTRRYARKARLEFHFNPREGKGSHGTLYLGERRTTVKESEISRPLLASMLKDLGIDRKEW